MIGESSRRDLDLLRQFFRENFSFEVHEKDNTPLGLNGIAMPYEQWLMMCLDQKRVIQPNLPGFEPAYVMELWNSAFESHVNGEVGKIEAQIVEAIKMLKGQRPKFGDEVQIGKMRFLNSSMISEYVGTYWENHILLDF